MKRVWFIVLLLGVLAMPVFAAPEADAVAEGAADAVVAQSSSRNWSIALVCLAGAIVVAGGGFAIAMIAKSCIESTARQPEASGAMFGPMIITAAMIEGAMLFAIIMGLLAIMAKL